MTIAEAATQKANRTANGVVVTADPLSNGADSLAIKKKLREGDRRRRRRKQKKNNGNKPSGLDADGEESDGGGAGDENRDNVEPRHEIDVSVEVEYVPEKADLEDTLLEEFKNVLEKFSFSDSAAGGEDDGMKDALAANAEAKKKDSDSEEEPDAQHKEKGISNKKKKLQRRMKIAELKQICTRPDVVEVWDATAADPKLLVFLKSYRNSVPVPRHWCQKRKFLQGTVCNNHGARS